MITEWKFWRAILFGQFLSLLMSLTNIFTKLLEKAGLNLPIFQNSIVYNSLLVVALFNARSLFKFYKDQPKKGLYLLYLVMVLSDVGANYSIVKSFIYTSSLSVMLISSLSSIFTMFLSMWILKTRYKKSHFVGAAVCGAGLGFIMYSKVRIGESNSEGFGWLGSVLALVAAVGYSISNVVQEKCSLLEAGYPINALSAMGVLGSLLSSILLHATNDGIDEKISLIASADNMRYCIIGYWLSMLGLYTLIPLYLQRFSAVMFNFNLLTADLVVYVFNKFYLNADIDGFYLAGFFLILFGLGVYNAIEPKAEEKPEPEKTSEDSMKTSEIDINEV